MDLPVLILALCVFARSLSLALAYRRLDVALALDRASLDSDVAQLVAGPLLQRHALLLSVDAARKEAVTALTHAYEIVRQDFLLGLGYDRRLMYYPNQSPAARALTRASQEQSEQRVLGDMRELLAGLRLD